MGQQGHQLQSRTLRVHARSERNCDAHAIQRGGNLSFFPKSKRLNESLLRQWSHELEVRTGSGLVGALCGAHGRPALRSGPAIGSVMSVAANGPKASEPGARLLSRWLAVAGLY